MVPKVANLGRSFKGAGRYYLHDKQANTADRVAFTETVNLPTNDPNRAIAHMIDTATHADDLKAATGIKATGNKLKNPVYTYSIAWHPTEAPTMAHQVEAARESLRALGLSDRQALIVGHNDTAHPHVHVMVNRVCADTGMAAKHGNDYSALSRWAESYERRTGKILCMERVKNNEARDRGEWVKDQSPNRRQYAEWKKATSNDLWSQYRAERDGAKVYRKPMLDGLWQQRENRIAARKAEIAAAFKPQWRDLFKQQRKEREWFENSTLARIKFAITAPPTRTGKLKAFFHALEKNDHGIHRDFVKRQEERRADLGQLHKQAATDAVREVNKAWKYDRDQLVQGWKAEDSARLEQYRDQSADIWKKERINDEPAKVRKSFAEQMRDSIPKDRRDEAEKAAKRERKRSRKRKRDDTGRTFDID